MRSTAPVRGPTGVELTSDPGTVLVGPVARPRPPAANEVFGIYTSTAPTDDRSARLFETIRRQTGGN